MVHSRQAVWSPLALLILVLLVPASSTADVIPLAWDRNPESDVTGYILHYGRESGNYDGSIDVGNRIDWDFTTLPDQIAYAFAVQAYNSAGLRSSLSADVIVTTMPAPPIGSILALAQTDIVWHHTSDGWLLDWTMDGVSRVNAFLLNPSQVSDTRWHVEGLADFNGDGQRDLLWRHQTDGWLLVWFLSGGTRAGSALLTPQRVDDADWRIFGVADLNNDGSSDLLWRHRRDGWLLAWYMSGTTRLSSALLSPSRVDDTQWQIVGTGDFNVDGSPDLLWQHETEGWVLAWYMSGVTRLGSDVLCRLSDPLWRVAAVGDLTVDGRHDLLWRHGTTGWLAAWSLDGLTVTGSAPLAPSRVADTGWRLVGIR